MATRERTFYRAVGSKTATGHRVGVPFAEVLVDAAPPVPNRVLLELDLGAVERGLAGVTVVFLEVPPAISVVDLQRGDGGLYAFVRAGHYTHQGKVFHKLASTMKRFGAILDEENEDTLSVQKRDFEKASGARLGGPVRFAKSDELAAPRALGWSIGDEPFWLQALGKRDYAVAAAPWLYCGTVESSFYFGAVHAFFHRGKKLLRNVFECT
jgi:hypothetical protein